MLRRLGCVRCKLSNPTFSQILQKLEKCQGLAAYIIARNTLAVMLYMELDFQSKNSLDFQLKVTYLEKQKI